MPIDANENHELDSIDLSNLRLVQKKRNIKQSRHKQSSIKNNQFLAIAAAIELGIIDGAGLPGLLHSMNRSRLPKLLKHNFVSRVSPKKASLDGKHATPMYRKLAIRALPFLGRMYLKEKKGAPFQNLMNRTRFSKWVQYQVSDPNSLVNKELASSEFIDLCELKRGQRWWYDLLAE